MESWRGPDINIYTYNATKWVEYMNLSTLEWTIGYFPPNLVAIPGALSDTSAEQIANGSLVIENASRADLGTRAVEKVVFGVTAGLVILGAGIWLFLHWRHDTLFKSRKETRGTADHESTKSHRYGAGAAENAPHELQSLRSGSHGTPGATESLNTDAAAAENGVISYQAFRAKLTRFYYAGLDTELEVYEKGEGDEPDGSDVEAVTDKLRRMYGLDLDYWARQGSRRYNRAALEHIRSQSRAIWTEVRMTINGWQHGRNPPVNWSHAENASLQDINLTMGAMGEDRFDGRAGR